MFINAISVITPIRPQPPGMPPTVPPIPKIPEATMNPTPSGDTVTFGDTVSFGSKQKFADIKHLWEAGKLPDVKYGFYGDILTPKNISREHLKPASKKGKKVFNNIVLASKQKNGHRSNNDIRQFADVETVKQYLRQSTEVDLPDFNGNQYIQAIKKTLSELGFKLK